MGVGQRIDELHIYADLIVGFLHASFQNVRHSKLLRDLGQILRRAFEMLRRCARNHFQVRDFGQTGEDFILYAFGKISVVGVATEIIERQHRNRFLW